MDPKDTQNSNEQASTDTGSTNSIDYRSWPEQEQPGQTTHPIETDSTQVGTNPTVEQPQPSVAFQPQSSSAEPVRAVTQAPDANHPTQPNTLSTTSITEDDVAQKKHQAKKFMVLVVVMGMLVLIGIVFAALSLINDDSAGEIMLSTDEQLTSDLNSFGTAVNNYQDGNRRFSIEPQIVAELSTSYLPRDFADPRTNEAYTLTTSIPEVSEIQYIAGGVCNPDDSISQSGDSNNYAARIRLEGDVLLCIEPADVQAPDSSQL